MTTETALPRDRKIEVCFLFLLVAGAFLLRVWGMSRAHFWDEAVYLQNAEVICCGKANYSELDSRPPLLSLIFAVVFKLWHSIYAADVVTALINAIGPALLYGSGKRIVGRRAAAIAALLLAFLPFFVGIFPETFDTDNTGNSLLADEPAVTLLLLGFLLLLRALRRQTAMRFAAAGFVFALAVLMRFSCLSTIAVIGLLLFAATRWWRAALACAAGFAVGMAPYLCWSKWKYEGFFETMKRGWTYYQGARQSPVYYAQNFGNMFGWITLAGLILWIVAYAAGRRSRRRDDLPKWIDGYLWTWAVLVLLIFFVMPHQEPRYAMPAAPPMFLLAGSGLTALTRAHVRAWRVVGTVVVAAALIWTFAPDRERLDGPFVDHGEIEEMEVSRYLDADFPPGTIVYSNFNYPLFGFYSHQPVHELPEQGPKLYDALQHLPSDGVLIAYKDPQVIPDPRPEWLAANPHFQRIREFPTMVVYRFIRNPGAAEHRQENERE